MKRLLVALLAAMSLAACNQKEAKLTNAAAPGSASGQAGAAGSSFDPAQDLWLEEVEGSKALQWVRGQNARTLKRLEENAHYKSNFEAALEIAQSKARIPYGSVRNGHVYNFWQDEQHVRGLWRRTPVAEYRKAEPKWETLLDIDALASREGANWVYKGVDCLPPQNTLCLVKLSNGGKDAVTVREYDLSSRTFIEGGFTLPEAKSDVVWVDRETVLVATDWGRGKDGKSSLTTSGYPYIVKLWKRGTALADAKEVFRGKDTDVAASPFALKDENGHRWFGVVEAPSFFTSRHLVFTDTAAVASGAPPVVVPLPAKASIAGLHDGLLLVSLDEDWSPAGQGSNFAKGDIVAFAWADFLQHKKLPPVSLVFHPNSRQAVQGLSVAKGAVLLTLSDNVAVKVLELVHSHGAWSRREAPLPANGSGGVVFSDPEQTEAFLSYEGYLDPDALYEYTVGPKAAAPVRLKSLPPWFDAAPYEVHQFDATSTDGVKVPYFVVRKKGLTGAAPTLLYGYGGFQVSQTPSYSGTVGRLWLNQGGTYVVANIRGGGEFGPAWHDAGLKTRRQIVYDDFIAVAEDLIARGLSSKEKLGAMGGSNGGLLMGVMFTQRPDLFHAIVCQVPLLDMLRYHLLLAGASWMEEYGDPDNPQERAFLAKLSPYHNVDASKAYPEIYFETSTKDDRVHPGHARKMAHRLEALGKPFLYYENIDGGHSAAANQREAAHRTALEFTYLREKLMEGR